MALSSRADLALLGFTGFLTISGVRAGLESIPKEPGVYSVLREAHGRPAFSEVGTGGRFKGIDPNVSLSTLEEKWIEGSQIIYIGKAAGGVSGKRGLRKRVTEYLQFGEGRAVGHKGGRYIWQIKDSDDLIVCWKTVSTSAESLESEMLRTFVLLHGRLPFANLRH